MTASWYDVLDVAPEATAHRVQFIPNPNPSPRPRRSPSPAR